MDLDGRTARFLFDTDEVEGASDDVSTLAINADGSTLAVASSLLIEWDLGRNLITSTRTSPSEPPRNFTGVGYAADRGLIASESGWEEGLPGLVVAYPTDGVGPWFELQRYADGVNALAVNGEAVVAAGAHGEVRPLPGDRDLNATSYTPTATAISADGRLVVAGTAEGQVLVWEVAHHDALQARAQAVAGPTGAQPDGFDTIAIGGATVALGTSTSIELLTWPELSPIRTIRAADLDAGYLSDVALDPNGTRIAFVAASAPFDSQITFVEDVNTGAQLGRFDLGDLRTSVVFAGPDRVAVADESGAHLWNLAAGDVHTIVPPNELVPTGLAFDGEHGRLALAMGAPESNGVTIQVFDVDDPSAPIATVAGSEPMAFTPDGSTLVHRRGSQVAASAIETQQSRLLGPPIDPVALAIDAGSRYVAAGSADGRMLMLDLARGVAVGEPFTAHQTDPGASMDVSTSADGSTVMSVGSLEPVVVTWWYPDGWPEVACNAVRRNLNPEEWVEVFLDDPRRTTCANHP